ncbi:hypothetical protein [Kribbella catacumbae]|uniref:hypothetical protein n=1 Tax=Kribbella catacumbae TaxID=460086 RepID=UPI00038207F9|nr:hypothetical protein [Kribbella catacumbae]
MFSTTRRVVAVSAFAGCSVAVLAGWLTGFFARVVTGVSRSWDSLLAWLRAPLDMSHLVAATAAVLVPLVLILVIIMVLSDD